MRGERVFPENLVAVLVAVAVLEICLPLFITGKTSFGGADDARREQEIAKCAKRHREGGFTEKEVEQIYRQRPGTPSSRARVQLDFHRRVVAGLHDLAFSVPHL
jgi:hypothetical protein